jgi:hypothetical protein
VRVVDRLEADDVNVGHDEWGHRSAGAFDLLIILPRPQHDLFPVDRQVSVAITHLGGPIPRQRQEIARLRDPVTRIGCLETPLSAVPALLCAATASIEALTTPPAPLDTFEASTSP